MHTIGMTARHADGTLEYDAHNLYGLSEAAATAPAVADVTGKRPFILSRWAALSQSCNAGTRYTIARFTL
jgi:alpha-glucosidase (family GH31 glycosyl hydrolase)